MISNLPQPQISADLTKSKINVGLIGYGYWGEKILRNITEHTASGRIMLCDSDENRANAVKSLYHPITVTSNSDDVFSNDDIDAVIISTPTSTHFNLANRPY